jgi:hypothetical protein
LDKVFTFASRWSPGRTMLTRAIHGAGRFENEKLNGGK